MYGFIAVNTSNCETLRIAVDDIVYYDKLISEDRLTDPPLHHQDSPRRL